MATDQDSGTPSQKSTQITPEFTIPVPFDAEQVPPAACPVPEPEIRPIVKSGHALIDFLSSHWQLFTTFLSIMILIGGTVVSFSLNYIYEPWKKEQQEAIKKIETKVDTQIKSAISALEAQSKFTSSKFTEVDQRLKNHAIAIDMHVTSYAIYRAALERDGKEPLPKIESLTFSDGENVR